MASRTSSVAGSPFSSNARAVFFFSKLLFNCRAPHGPTIPVHAVAQDVYLVIAWQICAIQSRVIDGVGKACCKVSFGLSAHPHSVVFHPGGGFAAVPFTQDPVIVTLRLRSCVSDGAGKIKKEFAPTLPSETALHPRPSPPADQVLRRVSQPHCQRHDRTRTGQSARTCDHDTITIGFDRGRRAV